MEKNDKELSRRGFLKTTGVASLASVGLTFVKPEAVRGSQASSAIAVGVIGPGRRGIYDAGIMARQPDVRIVALADIYDDMIEEARKKIPVENPRVYKDYQKLLASELDAVLIATPPYQHPEQLEAAISAKKHIFLEKPVAIDAAGCRRVDAAARRADPSKDIVVGFQQRYGPGYLEAFKRVKDGSIGQIKMARSAWLVGDLPRRKGNFSPEEEKIRNWLFYRDRSGDILVEQHCHSLDVVNWFMGAHPVKAQGKGGRVVRTDIGDILDCLSISYEYPYGVLLSHSGNQFCQRGFSRVGEEFMCTKGSIEVSRRKATIYEVVPPSVQTPAAPWSLDHKQDITIDTVAQWFDRIRSGKTENIAAPACQSTMTAIMGRIAILENREVKWDEVASA